MIRVNLQKINPDLHEQHVVQERYRANVTLTVQVMHITVPSFILINFFPPCVADGR